MNLEDYEEQKELLDRLEHVSVPAIKLIIHEERLYVQMNIKSLILTDDSIAVHEGFLFEITYAENQYQAFLFEIADAENQYQAPRFTTVGEFPIIFHPHFKCVKYDRCRWVDYKQYDPNEKLGDYILRVAHSLKYESAYIKEQPTTSVGNEKALKWYRENRNQHDFFPRDKTELPHSLEEIKKGQLFKAHSPKSKIMKPSTFKAKKKFEVKKIEPPYQPEEKQLPRHFKKSKNKSDFSTSRFSFLARDNKHHLYIREAAWRMIDHHIGWARNTSSNMVEQGGILLGKAYTDAAKNLTYGVVEQAIDGKSAKGSGAYLEMTHQTWKEMFDRVDHLLANKDSKLQIIGWYHTHPNMLDVFMSGTDQATQSRLFCQDWQFAIVLNPQKQRWRAFYGSHSKECQGYVIDDR
ncbi:Mov34/MPN/PAD-1 [Candidatus Thiomargarita nelsonii]|uniref:Mov34/MPN/PAD-1 n=1 Tax=Candidatus Thiomargarita nelsonii TaxID=1003181 RepID=A0A0A6P180_9GAMM|nr:Mov34/MPN/PAD-1 [Candidatus Thiomargarita nelsonii]